MLELLTWIRVSQIILILELNYLNDVLGVPKKRSFFKPTATTKTQPFLSDHVQEIFKKDNKIKFIFFKDNFLLYLPRRISLAQLKLAEQLLSVAIKWWDGTSCPKIIALSIVHVSRTMRVWETESEGSEVIEMLRN